MGKIIRGNMKMYHLCAIIILTLLGTSSGNTNNEGTTEGELFVRRFNVHVYEDFRNMDAIIDIHLMSIDTLVSLSVDTKNQINLIASTSLTDWNKTKAENLEKTSTGHVQNSSRFNVLKTCPKQQIMQAERMGNNSTWSVGQVFNSFSGIVTSLIKWLNISIEWPWDMITHRTITAVDRTCPVDGFVNDSMFSSLELITEDMEDKLTCLENHTTPIINLTSTHSNTNPLLQKSQNVATENSEILANQTANKTADEKDNKPSKRHKSIVVFMGHYNDDESPELLPEFDNVNQNGLYPGMLQAENNDSVFPGSLDTTDVEEDDDEVYGGSESPPALATANFYGFFPRKTASEHHDATDNVAILGVKFKGNLRNMWTKKETLFYPKKQGDSRWLTSKLLVKGVETSLWRSFLSYYWSGFKTTMINLTWQDTFNVTMTILFIGCCFMAVYLCIYFIYKCIQRLRLYRRELEEKRERELELELAKQKALWRPKQPKKKRANYCGKLQNWN